MSRFEGGSVETGLVLDAGGRFKVSQESSVQEEA